MTIEVHPVERQGGIFFNTPPVLEFSKTLRGLFDAGDTSLAVHGQSRCGKSTLFNTLVSYGAAHKNAVVFNATMSGTSDSASWLKLARELADSRGGRSPFYSMSNEEALVKRAESDAHELNVYRVLVLIDEAQELSLEQFLGLKKFTQVLINRGLSTFVLQFGQPEILAVPRKLAGANRTSLVDRFFLRKHRLRGLRQTEYSGFLAFYDKTVWPTPNGRTYTEHYLPDLWAQGWRMETYSSHFQRSFHLITKKFFRDPDDIPVKYLAFVANKLLLNAKEVRGHGADVGSLIDRYANDSGIVESYKHIGDHEEKTRKDLETASVPSRRRRK